MNKMIRSVNREVEGWGRGQKGWGHSKLKEQQPQRHGGMKEQYELFREG